MSFSSCVSNPFYKVTLETAPRSGVEAAAALEKLSWKISIEAENKHICGGVILNSWWILSAAHCFTKELPPDLHVIVGLKGYAKKRRMLDRIVIHQDFNNASMANDIALILLDSPIKFSKKMLISVPLMHDLSMWKDCSVSRWSSIMAGGEKRPISTLQEVETTLISNKQCSQSVQGLTEDMLCAISEEGREGLCEGDSGGPLVCTYGDIIVEWFVVGIASRGDSCGGEDSPVVYTLVFSYLDWIQTATTREGKPFIPEGRDDVIDTSIRSGAVQNHFASDSPLLPLVCLILIVYKL
ncbi:serine protease 55-like [Eublepharis macularius]|uniref:Serine protease 55-like n=1 Tax=Eublepharis macularius TaxID=481883 RepID=A0AA97KSH0_EUBMA|nr:serine protease 55-like [Eublepharis macularius]